VLSASRVSGDGGDVLNAANAETGACKSTESGLSTRTRGLGASTTGSAELDVNSVDAAGLGLLSAVLSCKHGSVGGGLIAVSLDLHTTGDLGNGLTAGEVGDVLYMTPQGIRRLKNQLIYTIVNELHQRRV